MFDEVNDGRLTIMQAREEKEQIRSFVCALEEIDNTHKAAVLEVGAHLGKTAKIMAKNKSPQRPLYVFDTWSGMPEKHAIDIVPSGVVFESRESDLRPGDLNVTMDETRSMLSGFDNIIFCSGVFPYDTGKYIIDESVGFAHIDVDFYRSTKDGILYIFERLIDNGKIVCHDYVGPYTPGVPIACKEVIDILGDAVKVEYGAGTTIILTKRKDQ